MTKKYGNMVADVDIGLCFLLGGGVLTTEYKGCEEKE